MDTAHTIFSPVSRATRSLIALAVPVGLALVGCASHGTKTDQHHLQQLHQHQAPYHEVVAQMGPPQQEVLNSDGTRQVVYSYSQAQQNWQSLVPFADRIGGGTTSEYSQAVLFFDAAGRLTTFTWSGGKDKSGYGLDSGKKQ